MKGKKALKKAMKKKEKKGKPIYDTFGKDLHWNFHEYRSPILPLFRVTKNILKKCYTQDTCPYMK